MVATIEIPASPELAAATKLAGGRTGLGAERGCADALHPAEITSAATALTISRKVGLAREVIHPYIAEDGYL